MKREIAAALIILLLVLIAAWNINKIDSLTHDIGLLLNASESAADSGSLDEALELSLRALWLWLEADGYTHIFIRHPEIDATSDAFYELISAIKEAEPHTLAPAYAKLRYHLESINGMEHITLGSVL